MSYITKKSTIRIKVSAAPCAFFNLELLGHPLPLHTGQDNHPQLLESRPELFDSSPLI